MLVKSCGPELVDQPKRLHEMGGFLGKSGVGQHFLPAYPTEHCFPPVFLPCPISLSRVHATLDQQVFRGLHPCLQGHSGESKPGTFLECKNFFRPIFSVLIWTISELASLQRPLCILNKFLVGFGQIVRKSLPVFSFDHAVSHCSEAFCSSANLTVALDLPRTCSSAV